MMNGVSDLGINDLDLESYKKTFNEAEPYRFVVVDNFLTNEFCQEVCRAYPNYKSAREIGDQEFKRADEYRKIQITDSNSFPGPVKRLAEDLASEHFCNVLSEISGIDNLRADNKFYGAGMHLMQSGAWLSPHVDFNHLDKKLYRRLNVILYLNEEWEEEWGGSLEIWSPDMQECMHVVPPIFNRAVIFNTVPRSFHGVLPVNCPSDRSRNTFASFYYTEARPPEWEGKYHSTIWGTRPGETADKSLWKKRLSSLIPEKFK